MIVSEPHEHPNSGQTIVAIDFDGTLHDGEYPTIGDPIDGAIEYMGKLQKDGIYIIIWTCRNNKAMMDAVHWLIDNKIHFDRINEGNPRNLAMYKTDTRKIFAHVYVDDKQVGGLPPWDLIYKHIKEVQKERLENDPTPSFGADIAIGW